MSDVCTLRSAGLERGGHSRAQNNTTDTKVKTHATMHATMERGLCSFAFFLLLGISPDSYGFGNSDLESMELDSRRFGLGFSFH